MFRPDGDVINSTGGVAFTGKQIAQQLDRLRQTLKSFYLLAFDPGEQNQDDQGLAIEVRQHPEYLVHWVYRKAGSNPFF